MSDAANELSYMETDITPGIRNPEVMANLDRSSFSGEVATNQLWVGWGSREKERQEVRGAGREMSRVLL